MTQDSNAVRIAHRRDRFPFARLLGAAAVLVGLAACAGPETPQMPATQEAAQYREHARNYYQPPGPAWDPWGPYITEAAQRFDVPENWVRAVIHQESGGQEFAVSAPGAMGLMQVMPFTYDLMREQYSLGEDAYDPHNNILAGVAYIRQMYDIYGSPGFLAAYNAGPGRLDDFLTRNRPLPAETRHYVAVIGPQLAFDSPRNRSEADMMAMNHASADYRMARNQRAPTDPALSRSVELAWARRGGGTSEQGEEVAEATPPVMHTSSPVAASVRNAWAQRGVVAPAPVQVAEAFTPAPTPVQAPVRPVEIVAPTVPAIQLAEARMVSRPSAELADSVAEAPDAMPARAGHPLRFRLVNSAMAETMPWHSAGARGAATAGNWAIQVGAFGSAGAANEAAGSARAHAGNLLDHAHAEVASIHERHGKLFRARLTGLSRAAAVQACEHMRRGACIVVSPDGDG